jgi:RimJ/RimL family protein N-acetyltransferase
MTWAHQEPQSLEEMASRLRRFRGIFDLGQDFLYGIFDKTETHVLGGTGLHTRAGAYAREIGYWIHVDHTNQGLATEATAALVKVAFEIEDVQRVEIHCGPENLRSAAIPRRLGFVHEATLQRRFELANGKMRDTMIWSLFSEQYPVSLCAKAQIKAFDALDRRLL